MVSYVKVSVEFLVTEDRLDGFFNALEDSVFNIIWKEAPALRCDLRIMEAGVIENEGEDVIPLI